MKCIYPDESQIVDLRRFIEIVKTGCVTEGEKRDFADFVDQLPCDAVLLGCTELPIIASTDLIEKRIYDPIECAIAYLKEMV